MLIGLGVWQLQRMQWKNGLLAQMAAATDKPPLLLGNSPLPDEAAFRQVQVILQCPPQEPGAEAGRNRQGQTGWAFFLDCRAGGIQPVKLMIGWHDRAEGWRQALLPTGSHLFSGLAAPGHDNRWRLTAAMAPLPLLPVAPPVPADIPNNHFAYAIQWFAFAGVLLAIYILLVRKAPKAGE